MKHFIIAWLAVMAFPALATQTYLRDAHAWYNDDGQLEINGRVVSVQPPPALRPTTGLPRQVTQTLAAAQLFAIDSARLLGPSASLQALARDLNLITVQRNVLITGHTDSSGSEPHNQTLSMQRAQTILHYLAGAAPRHHYTARGLGAAVPVASNDTAEGRAQNRRVAVVIQGENP